MRISTLILSVCGFCIFYICNADWIDDLIEDYLGSDYEEIAPFVSSVTAGTEEFDQLVQELSQFRRRWKVAPSVVVGAAVCAVGLSGVLCFRVCRSVKGCGVLRTSLEFIMSLRKSGSEKEEMQTMMSAFLERKLKQLCGRKDGDEIPVKLLWKGGTLVESSIHCNIRNESKIQHLQRHLLQSQLLLKSTDGGGDETLMLVPSSSDSSTARKMAEIRKLLESEQELGRFVDKGAGTEDGADRCVGQSGAAFRKTQQEVPEEVTDRVREVRERLRKLENKTDQGRKEETDNSKTDSEWNGLPDPKLMNRIRLLESRLRLEELKNKNWISRMSRAEGILQQLNKQVERIEEERPVGTLTETLKITSTVTNWTPSPPPRRNLHFTMVNQCPPFSMQAPYMSLSELIKKEHEIDQVLRSSQVILVAEERSSADSVNGCLDPIEVGLPSTSDYRRNLKQLPPARQIPALSSATSMPQSSFLSKFLCR